MNKLNNNKKIDVVILQQAISDSTDKNLESFIKSINNVKASSNITIVVGHELSYLKYFPITKNIINKKYAIRKSSKIFKDIKNICIKKIY